MDKGSLPGRLLKGMPESDSMGLQVSACSPMLFLMHIVLKIKFNQFF